jgi:hypothetical protein
MPEFRTNDQKRFGKETILWLEVNPDIALGGMPPFEYVCKKEERGNETLIGFTFS